MQCLYGSGRWEAGPWGTRDGKGRGRGMGTYKLDPSTLALATYETPRRARSKKGPKETGGRGGGTWGGEVGVCGCCGCWDDDVIRGP
jgi:hypothetical protein